VTFEFSGLHSDQAKLGGMVQLESVFEGEAGDIHTVSASQLRGLYV
jgi:hypothetical protein